MPRATALLAPMLLALVSGCLAPEPGPQDQLLGHCPQWTPGGGSESRQVRLGAEAPRENLTFEAPALLPNSTRHLDLYRVRIDRLAVSGGEVQLRGYLVGNGSESLLTWVDYRESPASWSQRPFLVLSDAARDAEVEYDLPLTAVAHNQEPRPGPVRLEWQFRPAVNGTGSAEVDLTVTFHYRVCGAPV